MNLEDEGARLRTDFQTFLSTVVEGLQVKITKTLMIIITIIIIKMIMIVSKMMMKSGMSQNRDQEEISIIRGK